MITILGFSGSLRKGSYNTAGLKAAQGLVPEGVRLEIFDLSPIPLYNQDLEDGNIPDSVLEFKERIVQADALLIVTPEYNYSVPGVLKNALDWASRPPGKAVFPRKPVAIMGASTGYFGSARAQYHLRQICGGLNMYVLNYPEVFISDAAHKFDDQGLLTDEFSRDKISKLLVALVNWIGLVSGKKD